VILAAPDVEQVAGVGPLPSDASQDIWAQVSHHIPQRHEKAGFFRTRRRRSRWIYRTVRKASPSSREITLCGYLSDRRAETSMKEGPRNVRHDLLEAALWFAQSAVQLPSVDGIALIGSILTERVNPKDVDVLVYVADDIDLAPLASLARRLKGRLQSFNRGADAFLADRRRRYLGRTCSWKVCRPGVRASCDALHCGARPYLHDDLATVRLPTALTAAPMLELYPRVVRRCHIPADVENLGAVLHARITSQSRRPPARLRSPRLLTASVRPRKWQSFRHGRSILLG
jgi:hypothetical protein